MEKIKNRIGILGGGPAGLFMYKRLVESGRRDFEIDIFERKSQLGAGMPYSPEGARDEHITNVSANEIPVIVTSIKDWVQTLPSATLGRFNIDPEKFNEYKVLPRLFFGLYLSAQFDLLIDQATQNKIITRVHFQSNVVDIADLPEEEKVLVTLQNKDTEKFDVVIISTGHNWPLKHEGTVPGYFDSPYPPAKLVLQLDHPVAIKGASLTAIDAVRTLARSQW